MPNLPELEFFRYLDKPLSAAKRRLAGNSLTPEDRAKLQASHDELSSLREAAATWMHTMDASARGPLDQLLFKLANFSVVIGGLTVDTESNRKHYQGRLAEKARDGRDAVGDVIDEVIREIVPKSEWGRANYAAGQHVDEINKVLEERGIEKGRSVDTIRRHILDLRKQA